MPNKTPFVVDTNILMHALASSGRELPDNNSTLDVQTRNSGIDPEKVRGGILLKLAGAPAVIPAVVLEELSSKKTDRLLGAKNRHNLELIKAAIGNRSTKLVATRDEISLQNIVFEKIGEKARAFVGEIAKRGFQIPKKWEEIDILEAPRGDDEITRRFKEQARKSPYCRTWSKMQPWKLRAEAAVDALKGANQTRQREHLAKAKAHLEFAGQANPDRETQNEHARSAAQEELEAERNKPYLFPDMEILLIARRLNAEIHTGDNDFALLDREAAGPQTELSGRREAGPHTIEELCKALRTNLKEGKKVLPRQGPFGLE